MDRQAEQRKIKMVNKYLLRFAFAAPLIADQSLPSSSRSSFAPIKEALSSVAEPVPTLPITMEALQETSSIRVWTVSKDPLTRERVEGRRLCNVSRLKCFDILCLR